MTDYTDNRLTCYQARHQQLLKDRLTLNRITAAMLTDDYTTTELAEAIGVNASTVWRWAHQENQR